MHYRPPLGPRKVSLGILYDFSGQNKANSNLNHPRKSSPSNSFISTPYTLLILAFLKSLFERIKLWAVSPRDNHLALAESHNVHEEQRPVLQQEAIEESPVPAEKVKASPDNGPRRPLNFLLSDFLPSDLTVSVVEPPPDNLYQSIFHVDSDDEVDGIDQYGTNLTIAHKDTEWLANVTRAPDYSSSPTVDNLYSEILKPLDEYDTAISKFYTPLRPVPKAKYSVTDAVLSAIPSTLLTSFLKKERDFIQDLVTKERTAVRTVVTPLTNDQLRIVEQYWRAGRASKHIVSAFSIDITTKDLLTLADCQWLNDNIIDFYLNLVTELADLVYCWTTHFFSTLKKNGYKGVARWAKRRKINVTELNTIVVPINSMNTHWSVAVIDNVEKTISYYDSLSSGGNLHAIQLLEQYMLSEADRLNVPAQKYSLQPSMKTPQQQNGYDCGVFTCTVSKYIAQNTPLIFSQKDMHTIRRRMAYEIITKSLLPEGNLGPNL